MAGLFGGLFDFNHDGKMDSFERAVEFDVFSSLLDEMDGKGSLDEDGEDDVLEEAGIDPTEFEFMDEEERREALVDTGLEPDEFDC